MILELDRSKWQRVKFGDVVKNVTESVKDPAASGIERVIGLEHLEPGELRIDRWGEVTPETKFTRSVKSGQTLFGKRRSYQRKTAYAEFDAVCSGDILVFESANPTRLLPELLPFIAMTDGFYNKALETSAGSLSPRTRWSDLAKYEFDLPPLDQQERLADLLWSVEACHRSRLELIRAQVNLKLTYAQWLFESSTSRTTVATIGVRDEQAVQVGPFGGSLASRHFTHSGVAVLKINNLTETGLIDTQNLVHVSEDHARGLARYRVRSGDLLVAAQATVGRVAVVSGACTSALISQHLIRVRVDQALLEPSLLLLLFQCPGVQSQMESVKTKTTRDGLNTSDVANFELPRLSPEQRSAALFNLEKLETIRSALESSEAADGILKSAVLGILDGGAG